MRSKSINTINGKIQKVLDRIESIERKKNLLIDELATLQNVNSMFRISRFSNLIFFKS